MVCYLDSSRPSVVGIVGSVSSDDDDDDNSPGRRRRLPGRN